MSTWRLGSISVVIAEQINGTAIFNDPVSKWIVPMSDANSDSLNV